MSGSLPVSRSTRGISLTADQLNGLAEEIAVLGAITASAAELNQFDASAADGCSLFFQDVQLDADDVNALAATNITLVSSPGAGLAAVPVAMHLFLDFGSAAFVQTNGTDHLAARYAASNEIAEIGSEAQCTAFLEATADAPLFHPFIGAIVPEANKAIVLDNNGAAEYTTGTGCTVSVRTFYRVVPMAAFS